MRISVVEYGIGNVQSVVNALVRVGADVSVASSGDALRDANPDRIVLPGVGATKAAMALVRERGLDTALEDLVHGKGIEFLAICVGMQILAETCDEFETHEGLGWIPGRVSRLESGPDNLRVPHMGWNRIQSVVPDGLTDGLDREYFYFVHSYAMACPAEYVTVRADYGTSFVCGVRYKNIRAYQFHPEKSSIVGERMLRAFVEGR